MKVHKPGTDCEVEFTILANGNKCPEFTKPEDDEGESVAKVCYIPVADGETITIQGNFTGSALVGRVDILADGVFVANRIIDEPGTKEPVVKYWNKRKVEVKTFLHVPDLNVKKNHLVRPKVVEGNLVATRLTPTEAVLPVHGDDEARSLGVGSLAVVVSLAQQSDDRHGDEEKHPYYPHVTLGSWRDRTHEVAESGIRPEHELAMEVFPESNPIKDKKATQYWRDQKANRFGSNAWAYLVFYYRTQEAIDEAGAQPSTDSKALPPGDGTFVRVGEQAVTRKVPESPLLRLPSEPVSPTTPAKRTKKSLGLGQTLPPSAGRITRHTSLRHTTSPDDNDDGNGAPATTPDPVPFKGKSKAINTNQHIAQASMQPPPTPTRAPTTPASQMKTSRVSFADPLEMLTSSGKPMPKPSGEHTVDDLAAPSLPNMAPRTVRSKPIPRPLPSLGSPVRRSEASSPASQKPLNKRTIADAFSSTPLKQPSPAAAQTPPSPKKRIMTNAGSASPTSSSPPPPSTKRPRLEELAQKKARLQAEVQAKRDRRLAEQKKLEDEKSQQRLWAEREAIRREEEQKIKDAEDEEERREEEEAMAAEMEALERENLAEDEEMARLEAERELLEGFMREG